ncbi:hypothetical protein QUB63_03540 [Microcoleus sp. ARI1-B5]|uniref:hypothetical protein n=1 Tax=unclassified Microcoleus TaxID=2642155 RepID=UPI002FD6F078
MYQITPSLPHQITGNEGCRCDRPFFYLDNSPTYKPLQKAVTFSQRQGDMKAWDLKPFKTIGCWL